MKLSKVQLAAILLVIANIIWGAGPPIFKWSFANVHTFTLAFLRYFIPVVIIIMAFPQHLSVAKKDLAIIVASAFFGITVNIGFYFLALQYTASINAAIIACAGPAFLIILSMIFLKDRPSRKMLIGNLLGLTGILFIVLESGAGPHAKSSLFGNTLLIISTLASVTNTLIAKEVVKKYHPITLMFWTFVIGSLSFYPLVLKESIQYGFLANLNLQGLIGILFGSLLASLFAWFIYLWGLEYVHASDTAIFSYIQPLVSILVAAPLVHEIPNLFFIFGTVLVFIGMYIAENHKSRHHLHHLYKR